MFCPIDSTFDITGLPSRHLRQWRRVLYKFNELARILEIKEPVFVFVHMLLPHQSFVLDRNGNFQSEKEAKRRSKSVNYIDQLIATNSKLKVLIDILLAKS